MVRRHTRAEEPWSLADRLVPAEGETSPHPRKTNRKLTAYAEIARETSGLSGTSGNRRHAGLAGVSAVGANAPVSGLLESAGRGFEPRWPHFLTLFPLVRGF